MKELKKEEVWIPLKGTNYKRLIEILESAGEKIYSPSKEHLLAHSPPEDLCLGVGDFDGQWSRQRGQNKTAITLDQLASMFGLYQYKIGDVVKCSTPLSAKNTGAGWDLGKEYTIAYINGEGINQAFMPEKGSGCRSHDLQLVCSAEDVIKEKAPEKLSKQSERTISRDALGEIFPEVCEAWQERITALLDDPDHRFLSDIPVKESLIIAAYENASETFQERWLRKYLPPLKIKESREIRTFALLHPDGTLEGHFSTVNEVGVHMDAVRPFPIPTVVELVGVTAIEVDDPQYSQDLPF